MNNPPTVSNKQNVNKTRLLNSLNTLQFNHQSPFIFGQVIREVGLQRVDTPTRQLPVTLKAECIRVNTAYQTHRSDDPTTLPWKSPSARY